MAIVKGGKLPAGSRWCPRCNGWGTTVSLIGEHRVKCKMCHGWAYIAEKRPRPPPDDHHLIAMHCGHRDFDEVVKLLPLRELKEDWENV